MSSSPNHPRDPWTRLTTAARSVREDRDASAPYGFATRVAALALAQERKMASLFERFALRALGIAGLLALFSVALNYRAVTAAAPASFVVASADDMELTTIDAVGIVLDIAD